MPQPVLLQKVNRLPKGALDHSTGHINEDLDSKNLENIINRTIGTVINAGMLPSSDISYRDIPIYVIDDIKSCLLKRFDKINVIRLNPDKIEDVILAFDTTIDILEAAITQDGNKELLELAYKFALVKVEYLGLKYGQDRSNSDLPKHYMAALKSLAKITSTIVRSLDKSTYESKEEGLLTVDRLLAYDRMLLHNAVEMKDTAAIAFSNKYIADNLVELAKYAKIFGEEVITTATQDDKDLLRKNTLSVSLNNRINNRIIEYYQDALMRYQQAVSSFTELNEHGNTLKNLTPADIKSKLIESLKGIEFTGLTLNSIIPTYCGINPPRRNTLYTKAATDAKIRYQKLEADK